MRQRGFTVIEILALIVLLLIIGTVFWTQKTAIETSARDDKRKTAINSMYYALEEVYYPTNKSYPKSLSNATLTSVDPSVFTDPDGNKLGDRSSDYRYEGRDCTGDKCTGYSLRTALENEADFVRTSKQ